MQVWSRAHRPHLEDPIRCGQRRRFAFHRRERRLQDLRTDLVVMDIDLTLVEFRRALAARRPAERVARTVAETDLALAYERFAEIQTHVEHLARVIDVLLRRVFDSFDGCHGGCRFAPARGRPLATGSPGAPARIALRWMTHSRENLRISSGSGTRYRGRKT